MGNEFLDLDKLAELLAEKVLERLPSKGPKRLLDVQELADALQVPKSWIYDRTRVKEGGIPRYKVGKYLRFDLEKVLAWIRENDDARWLQTLVFRNLMAGKKWGASNPLKIVNLTGGKNMNIIIGQNHKSYRKEVR